MKNFGFEPSISNWFNKIKNNKTIAKNTGYLTIIEILKLIMPFIALPYIIKTVGADNYGEIVFVQTIISYFIIFINFGLDVSAVKDVSINRNDKTKLNEIVSSVLLIKLFLYLFSLIIFCTGFILISYMKENSILFIFCYITCFSEILFPTWFFQGIEKMKYLTIIRFISILFYTISIFIFVRNREDYTYVALLQSLSNLLGGFCAFYFLLKKEKVKFILPSIHTIKITFVESIPFFFSRLSVVVNNGIAKILSGIFFSMHLVAAYDLAQKIAYVAIIPMQMLNQAVYPHIAKTRNKIFANKFFYFNILLSLIVSIFVFCLAPIGVKFFSDNMMLEAINILRILCLFIFFGGITTYIGSPVLVSFGYPKPFNISVIISTLVLLFLYLILYLTGQFSVYNFAISICIAEFVILIYRLYFCYHYKIFSITWNKNN